MLNHVPQRPFDLDEDLVNKNLRSSKKGAAPGPPGMTTEHLRPLLPDHGGLHLFFRICERLARAEVPDAVVNIIRMGRLTVLSKPDGGVRGIVAGDVVRRLVARTMSQQLSPAVERATSPFQYAMTTRAGCECVAHALQGLTETDPEVTVTSIDGLGAFDTISRGAMLQGLRRVSGAALPFTRMFYGRGSEYLWEMDDGEIHRIPQGEGGEQGDPMMPLLYSLGQHGALEVAHSQFTQGERLFAFLDDTFIVTPTAAGVGHAYGCVEAALRTHCGIQVHVGKTKVWNRAGNRPAICDVLERIAQAEHPRARVWRGSQVPSNEQGIKVLGTPLGHADYVSRHLQTVLEEQHILLDRIPRVQDVQSAWLILLHCASARANYHIRAVHPAATSAFAAAHDARLWQCMCSILQVDPMQVDDVRETATLPLSLRGLGLRSAQRTSIPAFWASWADSLAMIRQRHPDVAVQLVHELEGHPESPCLQAAAHAARSLHEVHGFVPPSWEALSHGARPEPVQPDEFEPGCQRGWWQHEAASKVEAQFRDTNLFSRLDNASKALVRSQGGVGAGLAFTCPLCRVTRLEPHLLRVLLFTSSSSSPPPYRAQLPVWPPTRFHWPPECRGLDLPGGRRQSHNECYASRFGFARAEPVDTRRLEVECRTASLFLVSVQLAVDTTNGQCSTCHLDEARRGAARQDGVALAAARRRKERTYPELVARGARARLVVLGVEVGGRWSRRRTLS